LGWQMAAIAEAILSSVQANFDSIAGSQDRIA
jgi:hypothetical protein